VYISGSSLLLMVIVELISNNVYGSKSVECAVYFVLANPIVCVLCVIYIYMGCNECYNWLTESQYYL